MRDKDIELSQKEEIVKRMESLEGEEVLDGFLDTLNFDYDDILEEKEVNNKEDLYKLSLEKLRNIEEEYNKFINDHGTDNDYCDDEY